MFLLSTYDRVLQEQLILNSARIVRNGYIHIGLLVISVTLLTRSFVKTIWTRVTKGNAYRSSKILYQPPIYYGVALQTAIGVSLALSIISSTGDLTCKSEPIFIAYVFCIHMISLVGPSRSDPTINHLLSFHVIALLCLIKILVFLMDILPSLLLHEDIPILALRWSMAASLLSTILIYLSSHRSVFGQNPEDVDPRHVFEPKVPVLAPEEYCSPISYCVTYGWLDGLIFRGCRHTLTLDDLPPLPSYDEPLIWLRKILDARQRGVTQLKTLALLMHQELFFQALFAMTTAVLEFIAPFAMNRLLSYLQDPDDAVVRPIAWVLLLFFGPVARSVSYQQYIFTSTRFIVRITNSMIQEIYHKAMDSIVFEGTSNHHQLEKEGKSLQASPAPETTSTEASQPGAFGVGFIMNLMSFDVDAVESARDIVLISVAVPIEVAIAVSFLYVLIGWSSLVGLASMLITLSLPAFFSHKMVNVQQGVMKYTDKRISRISEYLNSIRIIKYFGWEDVMSRNIKDMRLLEQTEIWRRNLYAVAVVWSGDFIPLFSLFAMFATYVLGTGQSLRADVAFTCLAVVETLRQQFIWVSNVSGFISQAAVSIKRLDRFFEEAVPMTNIRIGKIPSFEHATFARSPCSNATFRLQDLHFDFLEAQLNVVAGPTGCGKTTLLLSLLGETIMESGQATCPADVAYVSQTPWLQSLTVRENIIFNSDFDQVRYDTTIQACGLLKDFEELPQGDLTEVAEQGAILSGGQRQRVALARAVYSSASTLLLDDVFSALDVHTTNHIFNELFCKGFLGQRTIILVSHMAAVIDAASMIVELEDGRVTSVATKPSSFRSVDGGSRGDVALPSGAVSHSAGLSETSSSMLPASGKVKLEDMLRGRIPRTLFFKYMLLFGGYPYAILALFTAFLTQVAFFTITLWLSVWTGAYSRNDTIDIGFYLGIYACTLLGFNLMVAVNNLVFQYGSWKAARALHTRLTDAILNSPIRWFDHQPIGTILNRFSNDIQSLDSVLLNWLRMTLDNQLRLLLRIGGIASILPIFALPAAVLCTIGFAVGEVYTRAQISIKRLTSATRSPVFAHFSETLIGLPVIRAQRGMKEIFGRILADHLRNNSRAFEALYNSNRWVSVRADAVAASVSAAAGIIAIVKSDTISPGLVGFSLTNAIGLSQTILSMVRNMNELEVELNSFQRVLEFTSLESEEAEAAKTDPGAALKKPPASWPPRGEITVRNFSASYTTSGPDVIRNISLHIHPGERIGIVGRTGSGKSTLALSLLRFTHKTSGSIEIDGVNTGEISLGDLRRTVTIIPQESTLFAGNVRSNIDPSNEIEDTELNNILRAVLPTPHDSKSGNQIYQQTEVFMPLSSSGSSGSRYDSEYSNDGTLQPDFAPTSSAVSLSTPVAINGSNFSRGQRQALCMARAVCRRSKIVILDEATSSVDERTDALIQQVLRTEFVGSTILTIAHRLRTIMDYDRILVLAAGQVVELDTPRNLIERKEGVFWEMVRDSGAAEELAKLVK